VRTVLLGIGVFGAIGFAVLRGVPAPQPVPSHPFLEGLQPLVFAHRGGSGLWPENTVHAFRQAVMLGVDVLEMDVRWSADGHLVVFHDADLHRTTNGKGAVAMHSLAELTALDAGYHFSPDGGRTFPFRGLGLRIPTVSEVFRDVPEIRMNLELKTSEPMVAEALCALVRSHAMQERVLVASFHQEPVDDFRARCPEVATAATFGEASRFTIASTLRLPNLVRPRAKALQMFERLGPLKLVNPRLVSHARHMRLPVHVWHVDDVDAAQRLIKSGVAGIMTDRPDRVLALLGRKGTGPEAVSPVLLP
jgi:glycerophosphoryl diester phosphodiesterase